jgi:hypothetical protein
VRATGGCSTIGASLVYFLECFANHANVYAGCTNKRLGRALMPCEASGMRTSALSTLQSFSAA